MHPRTLISLALTLLLSATVANAGPNGSGTLIVHANTGITVSSDPQNYCGQSAINSCADAVTRVDQTTPLVLFVLASFPENSAPRLTGVTFGVIYDPAITLMYQSACGDFELPTGAWPASGEGTAVTWNAARTAHLSEVYAFAAYDYYGTPARFTLAPHPTQGGWFADDSIPARLDPIIGYGELGFYQAGENPCPLPTGACCFPDGTCTIASETDCTGTFQGAFTSCDPDPCPQPPGACCFDDGTCIETTAADCAGAYYGNFTTCDPNPCPAKQACCWGDGTCLWLFLPDCEQGNGIAMGPGSVCDPNPCPQPTGACCLPGGECHMLLVPVCEQFGGIPLEPGSTCEPNPCIPPTGACCFNDGTCTETTAADCAGVYQGDFTSCAPNPCPQPTGACCFNDGTCAETTAADCAGVYQGDFTSCAPNPCPLPTGACCSNDGTCAETTAAGCTGTYQGDLTHCDPNPCPLPCPGHGVARRENTRPTLPTPATWPNEPGEIAARGHNAGGVLLLHSNVDLVYSSDGPGTFCGQSNLVDCSGANVRSDQPGFAVIHALAAFPPNSSPRLGGITFGITYGDCVVLDDWGACGDFELPNPGWPNPGEGTAVTWDVAQTELLTEVYWFAAYDYFGTPGNLTAIPHPTQGGWFGDDSVPSRLDAIADYGRFGFYEAGRLPCPLPLPEIGACCFLDGTCIVTNQAVCTGTYLGNFTTCDPNPCPQPTGACCYEDGACIVTTGPNCAGIYSGDFTACDPNPCPQLEACCLEDGRCVMALPNACTGGGGTPQGIGSICDPNPCPQPEACCYPDGNCSMILSADCAQSGGLPQGPDTSCNPNPCPQPTGACCYNDGSCSVTFYWECGGTYQGHFTTCDPNPCPQPGACCLLSGDCIVTLEAACLAAQGTFLGEGVPCGAEPCEPRGACCVNTVCSITTAADCMGAGGTYQGDGTPCSPNPCAPPPGDCLLAGLDRTGTPPDPLGGDARALGAAEAHLQPGDRSQCGTLVMNADGSYENGYAWVYGGIAPPYYGAFAESYVGDVGVCNAVFDLTQIGNQGDRRMDVYLWQDDGGCPGTVACLKTGVLPGPIAYWPEVSRHTVSLDNCCVYGRWWVGYWGDWPGQFGGWYVAADENGFGGYPATNFAPGIGYPTGWHSVRLVSYWSAAEALGIGAEVVDCSPTPTERITWGRIKVLMK